MGVQVGVSVAVGVAVAVAVRVAVNVAVGVAVNVAVSVALGVGEACDRRDLTASQPVPQRTTSASANVRMCGLFVVMLIHNLDHRLPSNRFQGAFYYESKRTSIATFGRTSLQR